MQDKVKVQGPGGELTVDEARLRAKNVELLVWSWYLIGDFSTSNDYRAKVQQALARLGLGETGCHSDNSGNTHAIFPRRHARTVAGFS